MAMTDVKSLFIDTNILIYATNEDSIWHLPAVASLHAARQLGIELVISPQILREYLAAATRLTVPNNKALLPKILGNFEIFLNEFRLVDENRLVSIALSQLLQRIPVGGKQIHDANIMATMQAHGIQYLLTHNAVDFARFSALVTILPLENNPLTGA